MAKEKKSGDLMETIVSLCRRRGFIFQSSEIYGGLNGFFDYGPLGAELRKNIKDAWWQHFVQTREDIVGLDASIIMNPKVWEASGHVGGFSDPMVDCKESKMRYRADHIFFSEVKVDGKVIGYVSVMESPGMEAEAKSAAEKMKRKQGIQGELEALSLRDYTEAKPEEYALIPSPATGIPGSLTEPRDFNMMFQTHVGALRDESAIAYLRPETAQGIFANFKNVTDSTRVKIPFGIAQIGKAFRNEITPRNFIFRSREFEQMEIEYFIDPSEETWPKVYREWIDNCKAWLESIGLKTDLLSEYIHPEEKLSHYSKGTTDIMFEFPFGVQELWGIACRGNFDLTQHENHSGKSLQYFDESNREKYVPHVVEPSVGVDRILLAVLCSAYNEDEIDGEKRVVLHFHPRIAPIKAAIFPLVKNKPELMEKAQALYTSLQKRFPVFFDASGNIGRRYRRQDEVGTPFGVTLDFDTLEDNTVTIRDRDTTEQTRIPISEVASFLDRKIYG
ncbi:MAG: glycine--tRNA ligase [Verrucomicrobiota bacterium]